MKHNCKTWFNFSLFKRKTKNRLYVDCWWQLTSWEKGDTSQTHNKSNLALMMLTCPHVRPSPKILGQCPNGWWWTFPSEYASTFTDLCTLISSLKIHLSYRVRISFLLSVCQLCVSFQVLESCQLANQHTFSDQCIRGIPVISVTVSASQQLLSILFSLDFSNILRSFCFLILLYVSLLSMSLSSSSLLLFQSLFASFLVSLSLSLQTLCPSTSLPLTLNLPSVWSSDRKS